MFDYFKKHGLTISEDVPEKSGKQKKDKVFVAILIVFAVILAIGFVTGVGGAADSTEIENNFKFQFNISDGIMVGGLIIGYIIMRIRKGQK
ncbi:MAG: hypothetical protein HDT43_09135 [Ruminococcaceae bacterium]|nr:hypothetical protein [Oscillospiraceae bacterium]